MITFLCALLMLFLGSQAYGRIVERIFCPTDNPTPAVRHPDGVDYVPMKNGRIFLIQLLNIAGTGPIFGALMGATFGPIVYLWIVFGSILGGAVHDYMTGMISVRMDGASVSEIVGKYLGKAALYIMRVFSVVLLVLVGAVFTTSPAMLIAKLTPEALGKSFWVVVILIYYILATILPIDKIIGKIYPIFGIILIVMAVGIIGGLVIKGYPLPELVLANQNPTGKSVWPYMFITVACGAISGFHATQSPMMARCIQSEKSGRRIFYNAMIAEGVIALVWAAAGVSFYKSTGGLQEALNAMGQSGVVYDISESLLGVVGGALAVIGVVVCPVSSGDTAFRSARLTLADWFGVDQTPIKNRMILALPMLAAGGFLTTINFDIVWRYFSWSNQTLAMIALWTFAVFLAKNAKKGYYSLICALPGAFMTAVSITYILVADEGFRVNTVIAYPIGIVASVIAFGWFLINMKNF